MNQKNRPYNREEEKREFRRVEEEEFPRVEPEPIIVELPLESNEGFVLRREQRQLMFPYKEPRGSC